MGETADPPWVHAAESASHAATEAVLAQNQMDRLLSLLVAAHIIDASHATWVKNAPR